LLGQWSGFHVPQDPTLAGTVGGPDTVHRAGKPLGERKHRERQNGKLGDELLKREIFCTLQEAQVLVERWRQQYKRRRPHSTLGNRPPAPEAYLVPNWGSPLTAAAAFGLT
jgi:putative transposase